MHPTRRLTLPGAGLLVWNDPGNYVRLERAAILRRRESSLSQFRTAEQEPSVGGQPTKSRTHLYPSGWRVGNKLTASVSPDEARPRAELESLTVDYPAKLKVGVAAVNSATVPFTRQSSRSIA